MCHAGRVADRPMTSPADAYTAAKRRAKYPQLTAFAADAAFEFDEFQLNGCRALEDGHGVLVCAPTGAGKTVVGEFAVHLALAEGRKCFYTTPIKALSNQKYADLLDRYGPKAVGLLTGDTSINGNAQVVVMTTEVLRNMLYAGSSTLKDLGYVVLDEIHYLADRFRGAVWEEVILHLPEYVRVAGLSATVSNAEEFGEWLVAVRGDTTVVVDEHRPVPLWQHMMVGNRLYDLFADAEDVSTDGGRARIHPSLLRRTEEVGRTYGAGGLRGPRGRKRSYPQRTPRFRPPSRVEVVERLERDGLLPAIVFIFSRAGCDAAVDQCVRAGLRLNSEEERAEAREIIKRRTADLPESDLGVLGYWEWRDALERGVAAHHAGLLPAFKETVEEMFVRGLVKAVFATETLALGINMPARTVVLERLVKYNGEAHVDLTPGEYTQLTGRAGRRGIDVEGHGVVLWQPGVDPKQVAGLASTRTYPLRSSFRPGYNMAVNLVEQLGAEQARELLEQSFAQFQADRSVVGLARTIERNTEALGGYAEAAGDADAFQQLLSYAELRRKISVREKALSRQNSSARRQDTVESLEKLRRGDVISVPSGRRAGIAVVVDPGLDPVREPRPVVVTEDRWSGQLSVTDFPTPVEPLGKLRLPKHLALRSPKTRRDIASALRDSGIEAPSRRSKKVDVNSDAELNSLRRALRAHPAHGLADRERQLRWVERYERLSTENDKLKQRVAATTHSLARAFDRIRGLLTERGYLAERGEQITEHGKRLTRLYSESDLLAAECIRHQVWAGLNPAELAAVVSSLVFESRRDSAGEPRIPTPVINAWQQTARLWAELTDDERRHKLERTREPDAGFAWPVYRWARGESLEKVLTAAEVNGQELSAGDFVRWCRQVVDLLEQLRDVLGRRDPIGAAAADAARSLRRGVVAAGTV
jgi:ATP-dependent RNA helicase HelY